MKIHMAACVASYFVLIAHFRFNVTLVTCMVVNKIKFIHWHNSKSMGTTSNSINNSLIDAKNKSKIMLPEIIGHIQSIL